MENNKEETDFSTRVGDFWDTHRSNILVGAALLLTTITSARLVKVSLNAEKANMRAKSYLDDYIHETSMFDEFLTEKGVLDEYRDFRKNPGA